MSGYFVYDIYDMSDTCKVTFSYHLGIIRRSIQKVLIITKHELMPL